MMPIRGPLPPQDGSWASCIRLLDPVEGATVECLELGEGEMRCLLFLSSKASRVLGDVTLFATEKMSVVVANAHCFSSLLGSRQRSCSLGRPGGVPQPKWRVLHRRRHCERPHLPPEESRGLLRSRIQVGAWLIQFVLHRLDASGERQCCRQYSSFWLVAA